MPSVTSGAQLDGFLGSFEDLGCCAWMLELRLWSWGKEEGKAAVAFLSLWS